LSGFPAYLYLENGELYSGIGFGIKKHETAEVVFNTALSGYQEIITDPSYAKQIITFTNPHIGNTGINEEDNEASSIYASGIVIRSLTEIPSSWRSTTSLQDFLIKNNSIGISGIDTRKLVNTLRETGSQRAIIAANDSLDPTDAKKELEKFSGLGGLDLAKVVSTKDSYTWDEGVWPDFKKTSSDFHIVAIDFGIKENILRLLAEHVGKITVVNAQTPIEEILNLKPDGIFLSNGPGDPEPCDYAIESIKIALDQKIPIFGICLGHQLLAIAGGCKTYKMKFGHHGANHPVQDLRSNEVAITSQNHGFAIDEKSIPEDITITHRSLFDKSIQGIQFDNKPAFSFQGHPEASPGPHELISLFNKFKDMIEENNA
jgi:carbamoyl-phosphate synthase small subunit